MEFEPVSVNFLSKLTGLSHARCTEALLALPSAGMKAGHPVYELAAGVQAIIATLQTPNDPEQMSPRSRRDHYAAERAALALGREKGELLPRSDYLQASATAHARCNHAIQSIPDRCERINGVTPAVVAGIQAEIDRVLGTLADDLQAACHEYQRKASQAFAAEGEALMAAEGEAQPAAGETDEVDGIDDLLR